MKIRLLTPQHLLVQAGTEIEVDDGRAALLIEIGAAEIVVPAVKKTFEVETAVVETKAETAVKKTRKKA